jgi:hypothetical protein
MVVSPVELGTKNHCSRGDQRQFSGQADSYGGRNLVPTQRDRISTRREAKNDYAGEDQQQFNRPTDKECCIRKGLYGNNPLLIEVLSQNLPGETEVRHKTSLRIGGVSVEIRTGSIQNRNLECCF